MKVLNIRCHVGAQLSAEVFTSLDSEIHGCDMEMNQFGVFVSGKLKGKPMKPHFIPHSTIASVRLCPESFAEYRYGTLKQEHADAQLPAKNKGGRPPKAQNVDA